MTRPPTLVITGMHRSATSLVASMAQRSGVHLGEEMVAANWGNPRGYFEDASVVRLHDRLLRRRGLGVFVRSRHDLGALTGEDASAIGSWIAEHRRQQPWGFKDPRASLFLDLWDELLDDARYILLFRHPADVLLSLRRRASDLEFLADVSAGSDSWITYNTALLELHTRAPERCVLAGAWSLVHDLPGFLDVIHRKLGLSWDEATVRGIVAASELHRAPLTEEHHSLLRLLAPEAAALHGELIATADVAATPAAAAPDPDAGALLDLATRLASGSGLEAALAAPLLELLLASLDPGPAPRRSLAELLRACGANEGRISDLEERVLALQADLDEKAAWALDLDHQLAARSRQLAALQAEFDDRSRWALDLDHQLNRANQKVLQLQQELEERTAWALELAETLRRLEEEG